MASFSAGGSPGPAGVPTAPQPRLDVGAACRDGWRAFQRAPWVFTGFSLLFLSLAVIVSQLEAGLLGAATDPLATSPGPLATLGILFCRLGSTLLGLWGAVGTVRGARSALEGRRPSFGELIRWNGPAILRVLLSSLLLSVLIALVLLPLLILMGVALDQIVDFDFPLSGAPILRSFTPTPGSLALLLLPLLAGLALGLYVQVNQHFLVQLASLGRRGPWRTLVEGREVIDRQWRSVLVLVLLESLLLLAGLLALLVGFSVAFPVVACISTAAYRQLFAEPDGPAGLPVA